MPLESATYLTDLNASNPAASDPLSNADDHMRLIKQVLKATFPNFTSGSIQSTQAQIDAAVTAIASGIGSYGFVPIGSFIDFGGALPPPNYFACDGAAVSRTTYAALYAALGGASSPWGQGDGSTTFNVPNLVSRYRRHRDGSTLSGNVGNLQAPQNLTHTHGVSITSQTEGQLHSHTFSGTTGSMNQNASHTHTSNAEYPQSAAGVNTGGAFAPGYNFTSAPINPTNTDHQHAFSGTTATESAAHNHAVVGTTATGSADGPEVRPYSATVLTCIRAL